MMIPMTIHDTLKPAGLVHRGVAEFVCIQFGGFCCEGELASAVSPIGKLETAARPVKQDSDKFGDDAGGQTGGLIESCTRLKFSITYVLPL